MEPVPGEQSDIDSKVLGLFNFLRPFFIMAINCMVPATVAPYCRGISQLTASVDIAGRVTSPLHAALDAHALPCVPSHVDHVFPA